MFKLKQMGVPNILIELIPSFQHDRSQIERNVQAMDWCEIKDEVPQGTKMYD